MQKLLISLLEFYQAYLSFDKGVLALFAPGGACRYNPSCSQYSKQMINRFGICKGLKLTAKRIWSCK